MKHFIIRTFAVLLVLCLSLALAPVALMEETGVAQEQVVDNTTDEVVVEQAIESAGEEIAESNEEKYSEFGGISVESDEEYTIEPEEEIETDKVEEYVGEEVVFYGGESGEDEVEAYNDEPQQEQAVDEASMFLAEASSREDYALSTPINEPSANQRIFIYDQGWSGAHNQGSNIQIYHWRGWGTLAKYGCGFYTYLHAYQWLTGDTVNTSNAESLITKLKNEISALAGTTEWDCTKDNYYANYFSSLGIKKSTPSMSVSSLSKHFSNGGVVKTYTPDGGSHFNLAVGIIYGDIDNDGTQEYWVHIIDSSAYSTLKAVESAGYYNSCYSFNNHSVLSYTKLYGVVTNNRSEDNGVALEYWMNYNVFSNCGITAGYLPNDTTNPIISNAKITNVSSSGYTVTCNVSDNVGVSEVVFPTWTEQNGQDDIIWKAGTISGNVASFNVKTSEHNNETGCVYITHIYAYDAARNYSSVAVSCTVPRPDTTKPTISNIKISNLGYNGYTVSCTISDNVGVTKVCFPTWTEQNGQDDLIWHVGTISGNTASYNVKASEHKNETGCVYITHIYVYDAAGNFGLAGTSCNVPTLSNNNTSKSSTTGTESDTQTRMQTITVTKNTKSKVYVGTKYQIDLKGKSAKSFKSSKTKVATVNSSGVIIPKAKGKAKITIKLTNRKKYTLTLTVKDPTIPSRVTLNKSGTIGVKMGNTVTLKATLPAGTNSAIKWTSSNKKVATVNNGVVTFKKKGKVTITATAVRGKKKAKVKFKVSK